MDNTADDDNAIAHGASLGYDYVINSLISSSIALGVSDTDAKADAEMMLKLMILVLD